MQVGLSSDIFQPFQGQKMASKPTCLLAGSQEKHLLMEEQQETIYRFNGSKFLKEIEPEKGFFEVSESFLNGQRHKTFAPVAIGKVWVSGDSKYYLHAEVNSSVNGAYVTRFEISEKEYKKFQNYKGDKRRLNLFNKVAGGTIVIRKIVATKHIDVRVTPELYDELEQGAKACKQSLSDFCRELLKGMRPRAALSEEELVMMKKLIKIRSDVFNFYSALSGAMKGMSKEERLVYLVEGQTTTWCRRYIKNALVYLDSVINKQK